MLRSFQRVLSTTPKWLPQRPLVSAGNFRMQQYCSIFWNPRTTGARTSPLSTISIRCANFKVPTISLIQRREMSQAEVQLERSKALLLTEFNKQFEILTEEGNDEALLRSLDNLVSIGLRPEPRHLAAVLTAIGRRGQNQKLFAFANICGQHFGLDYRHDLMFGTALMAALQEKPAHLQTEATRRDVLTVYQEMVNNGVQLDQYAYGMVIKSCYIYPPDPNKALSVFEELDKNFLTPTDFVFNELLRVLSNSMRTAAGVAAYSDQTWLIYERMKSLGFKGNHLTYRALLWASAAKGSLGLSERAWKDMLDDGVYPGEPHYLARLRACGTTQGAQSDYDPAVARLCENRAEEIWDEAVEGLGQDVDLVTYQPPRIRLTVNLLNTYLSCFRRNPKKFMQKLKLFQKHGIQPNHVSYGIMMRHGAHFRDIALVNEAWQGLSSEMERGLIPKRHQIESFGDLVWALTKCGAVEDAKHVVRSCYERNILLPIRWVKTLLLALPLEEQKILRRYMLTSSTELHKRPWYDKEKDYKYRKDQQSQLVARRQETLKELEEYFDPEIVARQPEGVQKKWNAFKEGRVLQDHPVRKRDAKRFIINRAAADSSQAMEASQAGWDPRDPMGKPTLAYQQHRSYNDDEADDDSSVMDEGLLDLDEQEELEQQRSAKEKKAKPQNGKKVAAKAKAQAAQAKTPSSADGPEIEGVTPALKKAVVRGKKTQLEAGSASAASSPKAAKASKAKATRNFGTAGTSSSSSSSSSSSDDNSSKKRVQRRKKDEEDEDESQATTDKPKRGRRPRRTGPVKPEQPAFSRKPVDDLT